MAKTKLDGKNLIPGTRIPVSYLIDYIKEGYTVSDFVSSYPWVSRAKILRALDEIKAREFTAQYAL